VASKARRIGGRKRRERPYSHAIQARRRANCAVRPLTGVEELETTRQMFMLRNCKQLRKLLVEEDG